MDSSKGADNNSKGMDLAHNNLGILLFLFFFSLVLFLDSLFPFWAYVLFLGIPYVIAPEDLANPKVDEQSVMTYISYFRNAQPTKRTKKEKRERKEIEKR